MSDALCKKTMKHVCYKLCEVIVDMKCNNHINRGQHTRVWSPGVSPSHIIQGPKYYSVTQYRSQYHGVEYVPTNPLFQSDIKKSSKCLCMIPDCSDMTWHFNVEFQNLICKSTLSNNFFELTLSEQFSEITAIWNSLCLACNLHTRQIPRSS